MKNIKKPMDVEVKIIHPEENEYVRIGCHEIDERVEEITGFVKSRQGNLEGILNGEVFSIPIVDIYYAESVDEKTFLYLKDETYESRKRLYELEEVLEPPLCKDIQVSGRKPYEDRFDQTICECTFFVQT